MKLLSQEVLTYQDVSLVPGLGKVHSRDEIKIEGHRIVISAVSSIVSKELIKEASELPDYLKPLIAIPRDEDVKENIKYAIEVGMTNHIMPCIGLKSHDLEDFILDLHKKHNFKYLLLDIAHGTIPTLKGKGHYLKEKFGKDIKLFCGSVATEEGAQFIINQGFDVCRTGLGGSSSICSTFWQSGCRVGTFSELINVSPVVEKNSKEIMADSGFLAPADYAISILGGANYCMGATFFSDLKNAKCHIDGTKELYGMSNPNKGLRKGSKYDESFCTEVKIEDKNLVTLEEKLIKLWGGIRSAISYCGFKSVEEAIGNGTFMKLPHPRQRVLTEIKNNF